MTLHTTPSTGLVCSKEMILWNQQEGYHQIQKGRRLQQDEEMLCTVTSIFNAVDWAEEAISP